MGFGTTAAILGISLAFIFYIKRPDLPGRIVESVGALYKVLEDKYKIDEIYDIAFVNRTVDAGKVSYGFDRNFLDGVLVNGVGFFANAFGQILRYLQGGDVQKYATYIVLAIVMAFFALT
jgi:NADH-quinone oxidoreductase subunit L